MDTSDVIDSFLSWPARKLSHVMSFCVVLCRAVVVRDPATLVTQSNIELRSTQVAASNSTVPSVGMFTFNMALSFCAVSCRP